MSKIRIAVAGAGLIGRRHIELIKASPSCELAAVVDPLEIDAQYLDSLGVTHYADLSACLAEDKPDGVILATPNALHVEQTLQCIEAGVAALIEKPVAHSVAEGKRLLAVADATGARLLVGHHRAHSPILAKAREVIRDDIYMLRYLCVGGRIYKVGISMRVESILFLCHITLCIMSSMI